MKLLDRAYELGCTFWDSEFSAGDVPVRLHDGRLRVLSTPPFLTTRR
jgi:hypothetical protein